jgi:hypothetical protein
MKDQLKFFTDASELIFEVSDNGKELYIESKYDGASLSFIFSSDDVAVLTAYLIEYFGAQFKLNIKPSEN